MTNTDTPDHLLYPQPESTTLLNPNRHPSSPKPILIATSPVLAQGHVARRSLTGPDILSGLKIMTTQQPHDSIAPPSPVSSESLSVYSMENFELQSVIGYGSSAIVYSAIHIPLNKRVAVKIIDLDLFERNQIDALRRETSLMALSKHPNLLRVLGSFVHGSKLYIVTPYLAGGSCLDIMKFGFPEGFEEQTIIVILKQVLEALCYLHKSGDIHRDVKAGNLLMDEDGTVLLADFGVSSSLMESGERGIRKTFVGTPCWMAPEVMEQAAYDYKADIWSFGITAIELATGHAPFAKLAPLKVLMMTLSKDPPTLTRETRINKYSRTFQEMVSLCLNKDPTKRPSAEKLLQHAFFKHNKKKEYLVKAVLAEVPTLAQRPHKTIPQRDISITNIDEWNFENDIAEDDSSSYGNGGSGYPPEDEDSSVGSKDKPAEIQSGKKHISFGKVVVRNPSQPFSSPHHQVATSIASTNSSSSAAAAAAAAASSSTTASSSFSTTTVPTSPTVAFADPPSSPSSYSVSSNSLPKKSRFVMAAEPAREIEINPMPVKHDIPYDSALIDTQNKDNLQKPKSRFNFTPSHSRQHSAGEPYQGVTFLEEPQIERSLSKSSAHETSIERRSRFEIYSNNPSPSLNGMNTNTPSSPGGYGYQSIPLSRDTSISSLGMPLVREGSSARGGRYSVDTDNNINNYNYNYNGSGVGVGGSVPAGLESRKIGRFELSGGSISAGTGSGAGTSAASAGAASVGAGGQVLSDPGPRLSVDIRQDQSLDDYSDGGNSEGSPMFGRSQWTQSANSTSSAEQQNTLLHSQIQNLVKNNEAQRVLLQGIMSILQPKPTTSSKKSYPGSSTSTTTTTISTTTTNHPDPALEANLATLERQLSESMQQNAELQRKNEALRRDVAQLRQKSYRPSI
ncbi:kinase-like domain-containing protein [Phycomyces blakesleeanus]